MVYSLSEVIVESCGYFMIQEDAAEIHKQCFYLDDSQWDIQT